MLEYNFCVICLLAAIPLIDNTVKPFLIRLIGVVLFVFCLEYIVDYRIDKANVNVTTTTQETK